MSRYIEYADVVGRYPKSTDVGSAAHIESTYIRYSESWVDGALAPKFTAPFSSNNLTVKDLCIDDTYRRIIMFKDKDKAKAVQASIDARIKALLDGAAQMALEDGTVLASNQVTAWSETQDYAPTFGIGGVEDMQVSSARLYAEETARD